MSGLNRLSGKGVLVTILDAGMYPHAAFSDMTVAQIDFLSDADPAAVTEYDSHGTAVASVTAQVAPSSDIMSIRVIYSEGIGNSYTVAQGMATAVDSGAAVINLSVGGYSDSTALREAVAYAVNQGVVGVVLLFHACLIIFPIGARAGHFYRLVPFREVVVQVVV
ncbi:MAG: S8 family serine peptidase [Verrucomicrobiaceae bacterium]|nr:S8 family serine peptidase [Verrucomicrobiaceae bacterium]